MNVKKALAFILVSTALTAQSLFSDEPSQVLTAKEFIEQVGSKAKTEQPVPLDDLQKFVRNAINISDDPQAPNWKELKYQKLSCLLLAAELSKQSLNLKFDFTKLPLFHAEPPPSSGVIPGDSPELIKDPVLRVEYEKSISDNLAYANEYNAHIAAKKNFDRIINYLNLYIAHYFNSEDGRLISELINQYSPSLNKDPVLQFQQK